MSTKNRIFYYDALRALAIIGVVCCHVAASFTTKTGLITTNSYYLVCFFDCFRDFAIPIFVMLSGALLLNRDVPARIFVSKRFNRVFIPFIFWAIIFVLFEIFFCDTTSLNRIVNIILGKAGIGCIFWFIWMILIVYVLIFIINKIFSGKNNKYFSTFIKVSIIIFLIYSVLVALFLVDPKFTKITFYMSFIGFAIIGYYLANTDLTKGKIANILKLTPLKIAISTLILAIAIYLYYIFYILVPRCIALNGFHNIIYFNILLVIMSVCVFLSFKYFSESNINFIKNIEKGVISKLINSISKHSFGIYFIHYIILKSIFIITDYKILTKYPVKAVPLLIIVVFLSSWFIMYIFDKIPYLNKISGAS